MSKSNNAPQIKGDCEYFVGRPKTQDELIKERSVLNVLREREACAKLADELAATANEPGMDEFSDGYRDACSQLAAKIRAQSQDFKTMAEALEIPLNGGAYSHA
jgi:hypothetical protein